MHSDLAKAAKLTGAELPALEKASEFSERILDWFKEHIEKNLSIEGLKRLEDTDIVLLGSIARGEFSSQSDCDYFVLQNGAPPSTTQALIKAAEEVRKEVRLRIETLGRDGGFILAPSHNLQPDIPAENIVAMYKAGRK